MPQAGLLNITIDPAQLREVETYLRNVKGGVPKVLAGGINRTLDQTRTFVSAEMGKKSGIQKRFRDKHIIVIGTGPEELTGKLIIEHSHRLSLGDFDPKRAGRGVSVKKAGGGRLNIPGAFVIDLPTRDGETYQQVFKKRLGWKHREPQPGKRRGRRSKGLSGLKVISLKGPSPWGVFTQGGLMQPTVAKAQELLNKNIDNRLDRLLFSKTGMSLATARAGGGEA